MKGRSLFWLSRCLLIFFLPLTSVSRAEKPLLSLVDEAIANSSQWLKAVEIMKTRAYPVAHTYPLLWEVFEEESTTISCAPPHMVKVFLKYRPESQAEAVRWEAIEVAEKGVISPRWQAIIVMEREVFPLLEEIIFSLEEQAGYLLLWLANAYSSYDADLASELLEQVAQRYPETEFGKMAETISKEGKGGKETLSLLQDRFPKLKNPLDTEVREGNSVRYNLIRALRSSGEYKKWQTTALSLRQLREKNIPGINSIFLYAVPQVEIMTSLLDSFSTFLYEMMEIPGGSKYYEVQEKLAVRYHHTPRGLAALLNIKRRGE